jgi:hypothetical protein
VRSPLGLLVLPMSKQTGRPVDEETVQSQPAEKGSDGRTASTKQAPQKAAAPKDVPVPDLTGRAEQLGLIIIKTLDLAEAGLSLGLTVLTRAGAAAQEALTERAPVATQPGPVQQFPGVTENSHPPTEVEPSSAEEGFFLTNRVPLGPGGTVQVSFSITNDSLVEPKRVSLRVEGLVGEHNGVPVDSAAFAVRPSRKTIAPMDFEKFVLSGTLPAALPPDVYRGAVIVGSTDEMSIPVRLLVDLP